MEPLPPARWAGSLSCLLPTVGTTTDSPPRLCLRVPASSWPRSAEPRSRPRRERCGGTVHCEASMGGKDGVTHHREDIPTCYRAGRQLHLVHRQPAPDPYKPKEYGDVVPPMTIPWRLDCVLAATKDAVPEQKRSGDRTAKDLFDVKLRKVARYRSTTLAPHVAFADWRRQRQHQGQPAVPHRRVQRQRPRCLHPLLGSRSRFNRRGGQRLHLVVQEFAKIDLRPQHVSNTEMGSVSKSSSASSPEASNETAGESTFTPGRSSPSWSTCYWWRRGRDHPGQQPEPPCLRPGGTGTGGMP